MVREDREMAYPALMVALLPPGVFGILVVSLLAAFMSTIDTHFNWGASYAVNDVLLRVRPGMSSRAQVRAARGCVVGFAVLAVLVAMQIDQIESAWRWVAALGAALGAPTLLRWCWWRVTAASELAGAVTGLVTASIAIAQGMVYERQLLVIAGTSLVATLAMIAVGPRASIEAAARFAERVDPPGWWPGRPLRSAWGGLAAAILRTAVIAVAVVGGLWLGHRLLLGSGIG
jgi:Na+/proline symporter